MHRRTLTLYISAVAVIIAILVAERLPVPYVILGPGPTLNTLGKDQSGKPLITITGHPVYPTNGHLNMVSITYEGGPGHQFNVFTALRAWLDPHEAVVPQSEIFAPGQSQQSVTKQDQVQMTSSQQSATAAALHQQGIAYKTVAQVVTVKPGLPAYGKLKPGDLITAVDGQPVTGTSQLTALIKAHAGKPITLTFLRGGTTQHTQLTAQQVDGRPVLGVEVQDLYQFPFKVTIQIGQIGGPSAGTMFALGIIDKISTENLTGGKFIAGTGDLRQRGGVSDRRHPAEDDRGAGRGGRPCSWPPRATAPTPVARSRPGCGWSRSARCPGPSPRSKNIKAGKPVPSCDRELSGSRVSWSGVSYPPLVPAGPPGRHVVSPALGRWLRRACWVLALALLVAAAVLDHRRLPVAPAARLGPRVPVQLRHPVGRVRRDRRLRRPGHRVQRGPGPLAAPAAGPSPSASWPPGSAPPALSRSAPSPTGTNPPPMAIRPIDYF